MKKIFLQPVTADEEVIVQFTERTMVDKGLFVTVPNGYIAYAFIDEKPQFRLEPCEQKRMVDYGKDILGHRCRIAFIRTKPLPAVKWGFGNVHVNNERLKEAYRAGANGQCNAELVQPTKLIAYFTDDEDITVERLRERILPIIKNLGESILGNFFANTDISVFEISAHAAAFREKLFKSLKGETAFGGMGLELKDISANIYVNEEDVELIRFRINAPEKKDDKVSEELLREQKRFAADFSRKMDKKFEQVRKLVESKSKDTPDIAEQIRSMREELAAELSEQIGDKMRELQDSLAEKKAGEADEALRKAQENLAADLSRKMDEKFEQLRKLAETKPSAGSDFSEQIRSMREELAAELSERFGKKMQEMQETIADNLDERLQEFLPLKERAGEEYLKTLKVTAGFLIEHACDEEGLVPAAAMLYTNIEENLIKKFRLRYENKKFTMDYDYYRSLTEDAPGLLSKYDALSPTVLSEDGRGDPATVEMPPQVRFYEAGMSVSDSLTARDYWCFLNKLRHKSPENDSFLRRKFLNFAQEKKYLASALEFFRAQGLYTGK